MTRLTAAIFGIALAVGLLTACDYSANGDDARGNGKDDSRSSRAEKKNGKGDKVDSRKFKLGRIDNKDISESSGLAASRKHAGVYWTHNDSGNGPYLFAIKEDGHSLAEFPIAGTRNTDWEAIAADEQGRLYIADIGNNELKRDRALVYRVDEPDPTAAGSKGKGAPVRVGQVIRLSYPAKPFDAESLFLHGGKGYLISKLVNGKNAGVYRFDLAGGPEATPLEHVCDLPIRSPVTDAAVSDDGKRLAVMTVTGPNLFEINGDVAAAANVTPAYVNYFDPKDMNMEGVCFTPEGLLASTEQGQMLRFAFELFEKK
jgi:hypothetical protein